MQTTEKLGFALPLPKASSVRKSYPYIYVTGKV